MIANHETDSSLRNKEAPSDLVQQTYLEAEEDFSRFNGDTETELIAWMKTILRNNIANSRRRYRHTAMRDLNREIRVDDSGENVELREGLTANERTASGIAMRIEEETAIRSAIERLPEDYREVIQLHHQEGLSFVEIGQRIGRSPDAVRKLWSRAIVQLQQMLRPRG
jgi:RNA polymerase sigma-70 factor (ECF subfamily)